MGKKILHKQNIRLILSLLSLIFSMFACVTDNQTIDYIVRFLWTADKVIVALPPPKKGGEKRNKE